MLINNYSDFFKNEEFKKFNTVNDWDEFYSRIRSEENPLSFSGYIFQCDAVFCNDEPNALVVSNCIFEKNIIFKGGRYHKSVRIQGIIVNNDIVFEEDPVFEKNIQISESIVNNAVQFSGGIFQNVYVNIRAVLILINRGSFGNLFITGNGTQQESAMSVIGGNIMSVDGSITINHLNVRSINFQMFSHKPLAINIQHCEIQDIKFENYRNSGRLKLSDVKSDCSEKSMFDIFESYLGNAEFYNVDFSTFRTINIVDSHLVDCSFINVKWNYQISSFESLGETTFVNKIRKIEYNSGLRTALTVNIRWDGDVVKYYQRVREVYRQLKFALNKQGDIINEQRFHTREMIAYNRTLHPLQSLFTKLIIRFSFWFSDFGQSISRPLFWMFAGHFLLFLIAIGCGAIETLALSLEPKISEEGFYQYFRLINPLRRPDETFKGYSIMVDLAMRIWSSYMIYNIIRASRRFIK